VAGDDITRDRPDEKYLWLIYVRQRTKWMSCKVSVADGGMCSIRNCAEEQYHQKDDFKFFILQKANCTL
jgi:hypothetical protein